MRFLNLFEYSIHATVVHDGIRVFRTNQLALDLFRYSSHAAIAAAGIAALIAPESQWLTSKRIERLRRQPDVDLPNAQLTFRRSDNSTFTAVIHTRTLRWAFEEADLAEIRQQLETDIVFYSWIGDDVKEVSAPHD